MFNLAWRCGFLFMFASLFSGCALFGVKKQQSSSNAVENIAAQQAMTVKKIVETPASSPIPNLTVFGASNQVQVTVSQTPNASAKSSTEILSNAAQNASALEQNQSKSSITLPLGMSLILMGVGLFVITIAALYVVRTLKTHSAVAAVAMRSADQALARRIATWRNRAMTSQDPNQISFYTSEIAEAEAERGKLKQ